MWAAKIQMKWRCVHRSCNRNLSNCELSPKEDFRGAKTGQHWTGLGTSQLVSWKTGHCWQKVMASSPIQQCIFSCFFSTTERAKMKFLCSSLSIFRFQSNCHWAKVLSLNIHNWQQKRNTILSSLSVASTILHRHHCIHLIPKWRTVHYSFVSLLIGPCCLDPNCRIQRNTWLKTRQQGPINEETEE